MAAISWTYPQDGLVSANPAAGRAQSTVADVVPALDNLHFNYEISGDDATWKPVRAFDDGTHVYIEFPRMLDRGDAPPLFVKGHGDTADLVNYRVRGNYYVVDQLFAAAELRLGQDHQQVVRIKRIGDVRTADAGGPHPAR
jgi:type IV secretion system protein VirB9